MGPISTGVLQGVRRSGRFQRMMRVFEVQKMPKGIVAKGFDGFLQAGGTTYLLKHGTRYRIDKLVRSGQASFA